MRNIWFFEMVDWVLYRCVLAWLSDNISTQPVVQLLPHKGDICLALYFGDFVTHLDLTRITGGAASDH